MHFFIVREECRLLAGWDLELGIRERAKGGDFIRVA